MIMETSEKERINPLGNSILFIPDKEEREAHGKKPFIQYGWAETEDYSWVRPYIVNLEDLEKVPEFKLRNVIINKLLGEYTDLNHYTKARRTISGGLEIKNRTPYERSIFTAEFSRNEYNLIKEYF